MVDLHCSRIVAVLRGQIGDEPYVTMRYQCSPHHVNDALLSHNKPNLARRGFCERGVGFSRRMALRCARGGRWRDFWDLTGVGWSRRKSAAMCPARLSPWRASGYPRRINTPDTVRPCCVGHGRRTARSAASNGPSAKTESLGFAARSSEWGAFSLIQVRQQKVRSGSGSDLAGSPKLRVG
jgi:hypothetical protein